MFLSEKRSGVLGVFDNSGSVLWREWSIPGFRGPGVLPRLEDRGQPPFLDELEAGNVGGSREGSRTSPLGPHAGKQGLCTFTRPRSQTDCARRRRRRDDTLTIGPRRPTSTNTNLQFSSGVFLFPQGRTLASRKF